LVEVVELVWTLGSLGAVLRVQISSGVVEHLKPCRCQLTLLLASPRSWLLSQILSLIVGFWVGIHLLLGSSEDLRDFIVFRGVLLIRSLRRLCPKSLALGALSSHSSHLSTVCSHKLLARLLLLIIEGIKVGTVDNVVVILRDILP